MRLVAGTLLTTQAVITLRSQPPIEPTILYGLLTISGLLLLAGLWTSVSGMLVAILELLNTFLEPGDLSTKILLATLGLGLALLGPGAWSVDARLFGWKRIDIRGQKELDTQKSRQNPR
jgi:uncharacterized membrane protein YphA (DoxX/SURF4 family)